MKSYISILRGINVGGHRMIKMDALKKMCADLKFENVKTYIQSGNIVFQSKLIDVDKISNTIKENIEKYFGYDVPVLTFTKDELGTIINSNPFSNDKSKKSEFFHITFLSDFPTYQNIAQLEQVELKNDSYKIVGKTIYLYCPNSYSNSKLTNNLFENKLKLNVTTRNWKTTKQLFEIATTL
jgi:uncharacterized protein (DUF1697 family)